jgi:hypothetical protein
MFRNGPSQRLGAPVGVDIVNGTLTVNANGQLRITGGSLISESTVTNSIKVTGDNSGISVAGA